MGAPQADLPARAETIPELLARWGTVPATMGDHVAHDVHTMVRHLAGVLRRQVAVDDPVIAYETPPGIEGALLFLAVTTIGVAAPVRPGLTEAEWAATRRLIEPDLLLRPSTGEILALASNGREATEERFATEEIGRRSPSDLALVLATSGTTGTPKRVGLDHLRLTTSAANIATWFALGPDDHALTVMPLFHIHGIVAGVLAPIAGSGSFSPVPFDAFRFGTQVSQCAPTWCTAVPSMWELVLARWRARTEELRAAPWRFLRTSSSALQPRLMEELEETFGVPVIEAYGMTEAAHQITANPLPPAERRAGSVGLATGDVEVRIADDANDGEGRIQIRGSTVVSEYLGNRSATEAAFDDGWFDTGDQGRIEDDGRLIITGRLSEFINRGGEKISPQEIESALLNHPGVARAAAFALPHATLGQVPAAAVVCHPGADLDIDALRDDLRITLSRPKRPARLEVVDSLPHGPTGKLQRRFLADQLGWT